MQLERMVAEAILSSSGDAVIATDREGVIRLWSPGTERIFGHSAEAALGQSLDLIIPERLRARHWAGYRQVMETGESRYNHGDLLSVPSIRNDGKRISVEFTIVPLKNEAGRIDGIAAVMRDVTARFEEVKVLRRKLEDSSQMARDRKAGSPS